MTMDSSTIIGDLNVSRDTRIAIVAAQFNRFVVESLERGAIETLVRHGMQREKIQSVAVPGAYELPLVAKKLAASRQYDGIIALGAVIRGATPHFDYVASAAANGLQRVALDTDIPVVFGVLTTDTLEQAIDRAGAKAGNKGVDCAMTIIEMVNVCRIIDKEVSK